MALADHRNVINHALGQDLSMRLLRQNERHNQYVGLWSVWWSNAGDIASVRVVIATVVRNNSGAPEQMNLVGLPWVILQLQALSPEDLMWPQVYKTLQEEIHAKGQETPSAKRCPGMIAYETAQIDHARRELVDPERLQEYTITRVDDGNETVGPRPMEVRNRKRVPYLVHRGTEDNLRLQPLHVFIEKEGSKRAPLSPGLHSETGLSKVSTLLSAVNDWHTWIVLVDNMSR